MVARDDFSASEKLSLRWRGPLRVVRLINDYVYAVEDMRNEDIGDVHVSRLKFYHDSSLDTKAILSHLISSETGMVVQRLMSLVDYEDELKVCVRWKGLSPSEDTEEPVENIYQDVPDLFKKLLERKNTPPHLVAKAKRILRL